MKRRRITALAWTTLCLGLLAGLVWPILQALWMSFTPGEVLAVPKGEWSLRWYRAFFDQPLWTSGLEHSLVVGGLATAISVVAGATAAVAASRTRGQRRRYLESAVMLPLFVPSLVLAMGLLPVMRMAGLWGGFLSVALAHSLWGMPLVFLAVRSALEDMDPNLEPAARGLGARGTQIFYLVTLPAILPAMGVGAVLAFVVSFNELVMAIFLCTPAIETLPKIIWPHLRYTLSPLVAAASGVGIVATVALLGGAWVISRKWRR